VALIEWRIGERETAKTATFKALHDEMSIQEEKRRRRRGERDKADVSYWRSS
jgi:hypothetical protein